MTEEEFTIWRDQTRQSALEKEVQRLREQSRKQSGKIVSLRRSLYFSIFFFIVLFSVLMAKGMLVFTKDTENDTVTVSQPETVIHEDEKVAATDTLTTEEDNICTNDTIPVPIKDTKGTIFCIQIGAYTSVDLEKYKDNLVSLQQDTYEGINQFTLGRFTDYNKAVEFLSVIQQIGLHDAFIMSFKNGRRVPLQEFQDNIKELPYSVPEETLQDSSGIL